MHRSLFSLKLLTLAGAVSMIAVTASHAVEAEAVATRLKTLIATQHQFALTYTSASMSDRDVVLDGAVIKSAEATSAIDLGQLILEGVSDESNGSYRVTRIAIDQLTQQTDEAVVDINGFEIKGLILPADPATDRYAGMPRYDSVNIGSLEVDHGDQDVLWVENFAATSSVTADDTIESKFNVESFSINLHAIDDEGDDEEFSDRLRELDYDQVNGSIAAEGSWQMSDGRVTLSRFETKLEDIGSFNLTLDLAGYTPAFAKAVTEMLSDTEESSQDSGAQGMAMLGLAQQLTFHGLSIRFDDNSFTGRMLNHLADRQGVTPEQLIQQTKASIQMQLAQFAGDGFAKSTAQAVVNFLENPSNLEIAAKPASPVPFFMLGAALMGAHEVLINQLGLKVAANQ